MLVLSSPGIVTMPAVVSPAPAASGPVPAVAADQLPVIEGNRWWWIWERRESETFRQVSGEDTYPKLRRLRHSLHILDGPLEQGTNFLAALQEGFQTL